MATKKPADSNKDQDENELDRDQQQGRDQSPVAGEENSDADDPDGLFLLLEENAKLRDLVVTLTDILLETFADRGLMRQ